MRQPTFVGSSTTPRDGDAEVDGRVLSGVVIELTEFLLGAGEADLEPFDFAEPAFPLGFGNSGDQVLADLGKPCALGRVRSKE
ncbi:hypothetical protein [Streptomyces sp. enrichment culture]|uniref:hypothetical protein n=1 Tax=Streptomyces sp. enrichment culture TaxID=1795815 RepID=UPI003F57B24E